MSSLGIEKREGGKTKSPLPLFQEGKSWKISTLAPEGKGRERGLNILAGEKCVLQCGTDRGFGRDKFFLL